MCGEIFRCLTIIGFMFSILFTYTGFGLLTIGSLWNANLVGKLVLLKEKWGELRKPPSKESTQKRF